MARTKVLEEEPKKIGEQVKELLDGRTQRWLSFEVRIPENMLSKKLNDVLQFTDKELAKIEEKLHCKIIK